MAHSVLCPRRAVHQPIIPQSGPENEQTLNFPHGIPIRCGRHNGTAENYPYLIIHRGLCRLLRFKPQRWGGRKVNFTCLDASGPLIALTYLGEVRNDLLPDIVS